MLDGFVIENNFIDLLTAFSNDAASAFSSCFFPVEHSTPLSVGSFEKFIYNKGNSSEVYTRIERSLIASVPNYCICNEFNLFENRHRVSCRVIAIDLRHTSSLTYDAIATMRICNKALDGFNTYILVGPNAIHIGCDILGSASQNACAISYPITRSINWDALMYTFMELIDDKGFVKYYHSLVEAIASVFNCYSDMDDERYVSPYCTDEDDEPWYDISQISTHRNNEEKADDGFDLLRRFYFEVEEAQQELAFIKSNKVNSLEMLFDAEAQADAAAKINVEPTSTVENDEPINKDYHALLSDPEELIKALKRKNSGSPNSY